MANTRPAFSGHTRLIAERLVEAAFPAGEQLPAPDARELLGTAEHSLTASPALLRLVKGMLWWLELRYLATHGTRFSAANREARSTFLRQQTGSLFAGSLLRALSAPFRTAYLLDETNLARMQTRNGVRVPSAVEAARWRDQVRTAGQVGADEELECDVVVIGTGAGGATTINSGICMRTPDSTLADWRASDRHDRDDAAAP